MHIYIIDPNGKKETIKDPQDLLGEGGEAKVYSCSYNGQPKAAKIYKPGVLAPKMAKLKALVKLSPQFPATARVPLGFIYDSNKEIIGTLADLANGEDVIHLCEVGWKEDNGLDNNFTNSLFTGIHKTVKDLHGVGVIIGDLNYNNWKFSPVNPNDHSVLDVDSMAVVGFPCSAMHPMFFDPTYKELLDQYIIGSNKLGYKIQLSSAPKFGPHTDWYSFTVMLCWALMSINPWQGFLAGFPNEFRRMEARKSIFSSGVRIPKMAVQPEYLDDEFVHYLIQVLEKDQRGEFPLKLLKKWHTCTSCGLIFNRNLCPGCSTGVKGIVAQSVSGTCTMRVIMNLVGKRLLAHKYQDKLHFIYEENNVILNEEGKKLLSHTPTPDNRFMTSMDSAYIGAQEQVFKIGTDRQIETNPTARMGRLPVFDVNSVGLYRIHGNKLTGPEGYIGDVVPGKTWFAVGESLGFGFNRFGQSLYYFMFRPGRPGIISIDNLPNPKGKLIDWAVVFSDTAKRILFTMASEVNGVRVHEMFLIRDDGTIAAYIVGEPSQIRMLTSINGKAIWNGSLILTTTDEGVLSIAPEGGTFVEKKLFSDTAKFVEAGNNLYIASGGKELIVVKNKEIISITM